MVVQRSRRSAVLRPTAQAKKCKSGGIKEKEKYFMAETYVVSFHPQAYSETSGIITMFYVVRGLSPYTEYEFHVIGVNNIGRGPASSPVATTTGETGGTEYFYNCLIPELI